MSDSFVSTSTSLGFLTWEPTTDSDSMVRKVGPGRIAYIGSHCFDGKSSTSSSSTRSMGWYTPPAWVSTIMPQSTVNGYQPPVKAAFAPHLVKSVEPSPVKSSAVCDGYWADHVKRVDYIKSKWLSDYGHLFDSKYVKPAPSGNEPHEKWVQGRGGAEKCLETEHGFISGPRWPSQVRSGVTELVENGASRMTYTKKDSAPRRMYDYQTVGTRQMDRAASFRLPPGTHNVQFRNQIRAENPTSQYDFYVKVGRTQHTNRPVPTKHHDDIGVKGETPYNSKRHLDLDKLSMQVNECSLTDSQRQHRSVAPTEVCPKCENRFGCTCVPRRREKVPEDPKKGPNEELAPWPPQVWCGPPYSGSRIGTSGDIVRQRWRLSRDPEGKTLVNRMYDEMKALHYSGNKQHVHTGDDFSSCGIWRTAREAARSTWFDEQLNRKNSFTTGDTQFKSCAYMRKF